MAVLRTEATFVGGSFNSFSSVTCGARRQHAAVAVPLSLRFKGPTTFTGQQLRRQSRNYSFASQCRKTGVKAHIDLTSGSTPPINNEALGAEHILDDLSRFMYRKISHSLSPYLPHDYDPLAWLPDSIHHKLHKGEAGCFAEDSNICQDSGIRASGIVAFAYASIQNMRIRSTSSPCATTCPSLFPCFRGLQLRAVALSAPVAVIDVKDIAAVLLSECSKRAIIILREVLHFSLFYALFTKVDNICQSLHWLYKMNRQALITKWVKEPVEYEVSSFRGMADPLRFLIVVWAGTRFAHIVASLLKLQLAAGGTAKARSIGLVVAVTWFFFNWKQIYVDNLVSNYKIDAPRIFAFDKVVSLLMYFVAASCIGEVTGFALRSLLAVGGFSGFALGLAAKEIVSNFFGGAVLFITRPFVIGERIKAGNFAGYVQDIGFLQTKILSLERMPMVVPNQNFINQVITNYSRAVNRLFDEEFPVRIQDIFVAERITARVVQYLRTHPDVDVHKSTPVCYLKSINSTGIVLNVTCVLQPSGGSEFYRVKQTILVRVAEIITSEGGSLGCNSPFGSPQETPPEFLSGIMA